MSANVRSCARICRARPATFAARLLLAAGAVTLVAAAGAGAAAANTPYAAPATHHHRPRPRPARPERDPFAAAAMRSYLAGRADHVDAAVEDLRTGRTFVEHPGLREPTASIVKVDILETLLRQRQHGGGLSAAQRATATKMIELSDNDSATDLWNDEGGAPAVAAFDRQVGMPATTPNLAWGLTTTTAPDQLALLHQLIAEHGLLDAASQSYELGLMSSVEADEDWGVSGGIPPGVAVALKNGWLPLGPDGDADGGDSNWQVNSIGRIHGKGRWYLIAVLTGGNATEAYGIDTIEHVSSQVWADLRPRTRS